MVAWTLIPICLLAVLIAVLVMGRLSMLLRLDAQAADQDFLRAAVSPRGDGALVAAAAALVLLVGLG